MKKKLYISRGVKLIAFALAVIMSTVLLQTFLLKRIDNNTMRMEAFYLEEKGTVDAVLIGASDVYAGYSAPYAYEKYGLTSYPYATQSSPSEIVGHQVSEPEDDHRGDQRVLVQGQRAAHRAEPPYVRG